MLRVMHTYLVWTVLRMEKLKKNVTFTDLYSRLRFTEQYGFKLKFIKVWLFNGGHYIEKQTKKLIKVRKNSYWGGGNAFHSIISIISCTTGGGYVNTPKPDTYNLFFLYLRPIGGRRLHRNAPVARYLYYIRLRARPFLHTAPTTLLIVDKLVSY